MTWRAMAFWGCEIKPGKAMPFVPPPEAAKLHLSQVCCHVSLCLQGTIIHTCISCSPCMGGTYTRHISSSRLAGWLACTESHGAFCCRHA